jgi:hypothetical protein
MTLPRPSGATIRSLRLVLLALALGLTGLSLVALVVDPSAGRRDPELSTLLLGVTGVLLVTNLALALVMRARGVRQAAERRAEALAELEAGELPGELARAAILAGALVEAPGLLGGVTFLLTRETLALVAPAVAILALLSFLPRAERMAEKLRSAG